MSKPKINKSLIYIVILYILVLLSSFLVLGDETIYFLQWHVVLLVIGIPFLPITNSIFRNFDDKGYFFSKTLGLALSCMVFFWLSSLKILKFTSVNCILVVLLLGFIIFAINKYLFKKRDILYKVDNMQMVLLQELAFLVIFLVLIYIKTFRPAAYGQEKFMNYGLMMNFSLTDYFPANDFWMTGKTLNYYYIGQVIATYLVKLSFNDVEYGFNLMIVTVQAMVSVLAFSIGYTLVKKCNKSYKKAHAVGGGCLVSIAAFYMGNFQYVLYKWIFPFLNDVFHLNMEIDTYWFASTVRYIGSIEGEDKPIHEIPCYPSIVGDCHAHYMNAMFVMTILAVLLAFVINNEHKKLNLSFKQDRKCFLKELFSDTVLLVGLLIGLFHGTNHWDFPIYFVVSGAIILFMNFRQYGFSFKTLLFTLLQGVIIMVMAKLLILPFTMHFETPTTQICPVEIRTPLAKYIVLWGFPVWCTVTGIYCAFKESVLPKEKTKEQEVSLGSKINDYIQSIKITDMFVILIGGCAIGLIICPEIFYIDDIYTGIHVRANTMYKMVYQAFILFGICIGYFIMKFMTNRAHKNYAIVFTLLLVSCTGYYITTCQQWFGDVFDTTRERTLSALQHLETEEEFANDKYAIEYIKENISGTPVILEADTTAYTEGSRISVATGKPTVLGWYNHEWGWRGTYEYSAARSADIQTAYSSFDTAKILEVIEEYDIEYIYVGEFEYEKYSDINVDEFMALCDIEYEFRDVNNSDRIYYLFKVKSES